MRVLVVDDYPLVLRALGRIIKRVDGRTVATAGGVEEATEIAAKQSFDVIVTDVDMQDGTGFDLVRRLRMQLGTMPRVLFMTGAVVDWKLDEAEALGGKLYDKMDLVGIAAAIETR